MAHLWRCLSRPSSGRTSSGGVAHPIGTTLGCHGLGYPSYPRIYHFETQIARNPQDPISDIFERTWTSLPCPLRGTCSDLSWRLSNWRYQRPSLRKLNCMICTFLQEVWKCKILMSSRQIMASKRWPQIFPTEAWRCVVWWSHKA